MCLSISTLLHCPGQKPLHPVSSSLPPPRDKARTIPPPPPIASASFPAGRAPPGWGRIQRRMVLLPLLQTWGGRGGKGQEAYGRVWGGGARDAWLWVRGKRHEEVSMRERQETGTRYVWMWARA